MMEKDEDLFPISWSIIIVLSEFVISYYRMF